MKVYHNLNDFVRGKDIVATIGTFDGVHIGHQKLLSKVVEHSQQMNAESLLLTFYPHPRMVLFPENNDLKLLNTQKEKIELLRKIGIDHLVIHPFSREFSRLSSTEFVRDVLVNQLGISKLVIGYDHHFGRNREGSYQNLTELASLYDFELEEIGAQEIDDINVSSTKIRKALSTGDVNTANTYLNYPYSLSGEVIKGNQLGRQIGFPTANLKIDFPYKLIPALGAYTVNVHIEGQTFGGMLNIGIRPTVDSSENITTEVHIFNFDQDLYGRVISVDFVDRIREEVKFENTIKLKDQLESDKEYSLRRLSS